MKKITKISLLILPFWTYLNIFFLPYSAWELPLTQNWFSRNGLVLYRDIIYPHTQLTFFFTYALSKLFGNTPEMLRIVSLILAIILGYGIYLLGRQVSKGIGGRALILFLITFFTVFSDFNLEEMLAAICITYSIYFFFSFLRSKSFINIIIAGMFISLGLMSKQVVIGIIPAFIIVIFFYINNTKKTFSDFIKIMSYLSLGIFLGLIPFLYYYIANKAFTDFIYWNITFNLTTYAKESTPYAFKEGLYSGGWLFVSILPAIFLLFQKKIESTTRLKLLLLVLTAIFLSPSLLPSFLAYKILPIYPFTLVLWAIVLGYRKYKLVILFLIVGLLGFLPLAKSFYIDYLPVNLFHKEINFDYGDNEINVAKWIKNNTSKNEKIMNLGNHYIYVLSERLPQNKYVYILPWLVMPYDKSTKEIVSNPPKVVVNVNDLTEGDWLNLKEWPFLDYLKKNYKVVERYGNYEILFLQKK